MTAARGHLLSDLLAGIEKIDARDDLRVMGLTLDSRKVRAGDAFFALQGGHTHGITFAPAALALGASVVLAEAPAPAATLVGNTAAQVTSAARLIWIERLHDRVGEIAARFFAQPSKTMHVIGVTGTNGKTSTVQLLAAALDTLGARAATIGTLGAGMHGGIDAGERTTPDAVSVQALFAQFRDQHATHAAMEVSSHALDQGRVGAVAFEIAVFTNLTRDHLDYHGDMQAYAAAKAKLFSLPGLRSAVINIDDAFGRELFTRLPTSVHASSYGIENSQADLNASDVHSSGVGLRFQLHSPWGEGQIESSLLGRFNVANLLAVAGVLGELEFTFAQIQNALSQLQPVAGRMNRLGGDHGMPLVVIDYAHTPDALEQSLTSLRAHCSGKLICVFGCGGERDQGKRPQMGAIAERLADSIIITDDNPRAENGDAIVAQIVAGLLHAERALVERDRAVAISRALNNAHASDAVLIAGKGHEPYQEVRGVKLAFNDLDVARRVLEARAC